MVDHLINETGKSINDLDAIAYTAGPGLSGALLVWICNGEWFGFFH